MPEILDLLQLEVVGSLSESLNSFLLDRMGRNLAAGTLRFYGCELELFRQFCERRGVTDIESITPEDVRSYLAELAKRRKPRGVHAAYRCIRVFICWYGAEVEPDGWRSPLANIRGPKVPRNPLPGIGEEAIRAMIKACSGENALRDRAILHLLYSSGLRAGELVALDVADVNLTSGAVAVWCGKGGKNRTSYCSSETRKAIRAYLRTRGTPEPGEPLFIARSGERLSYAGLVHLLRSRAKRAGVEPPGAHDFRRAFAITYLRAGGDLITLARLMGHSSLDVLRVYLNLADRDLALGYTKFGPKL